LKENGGMQDCGSKGGVVDETTKYCGGIGIVEEKPDDKDCCRLTSREIEITVVEP